MPRPSSWSLALVAAVTLGGPALASDIVQAAKVDGHFDKLLAANDKAGTTALLHSPGPFTVFAPDDAAFAKAPEAKLAMLMKPENARLLKVALANHVVTGILSEAAIQSVLAKDDAATVTAINNMPLIFERDGDGFTVNGAHIKRGPIHVDNGLIYVVDKVLVPATPVQPHY